MTCILFTKTRIYTDTLHMNEVGEQFHSLTKVKEFKEPIRIRWNALETEPVSDDYNAESFVDTIHGYTCSGNNLIADRFIDNVMKDAASELAKVDPHVKKGEMLKEMVKHDVAVNLNGLLDVYKLIVSSGFVNGSTHGTIIMIGEKACYTWELSSRHAFLGRISRDNPSSYGTGAPYASKVYFTTGDALRAMYTAFWYNDDLSGGMIDIWEMPTVEVPELRRVGVCNHRSLLEIKEILATPVNPENPISPDLVSNDIFSAKMEAIAKISEQVGYDRGAGLIKDPMNRGAKPVKKSTAKPRKSK